MVERDKDEVRQVFDEIIDELIKQPCPRCRGWKWVHSQEGCSNSNTPIICPDCGGTGSRASNKVRLIRPVKPKPSEPV